MEITVYELINDRLKEIYVGTTLHEIPQLPGWLHGERRNFRVVEVFDDGEEARRFLDHYSHWAPPRGWRLLRART